MNGNCEYSSNKNIMNQVKGAPIPNPTDLNLTGASWRLVADLLIRFCRKSSNE